MHRKFVVDKWHWDKLSFPPVLQDHCHIEGQSGKVWRLFNKSDDISEIGKHEKGNAVATSCYTARCSTVRQTGAAPCAADGTPTCFRRTAFKDASLEAQMHVTYPEGNVRLSTPKGRRAAKCRHFRKFDAAAGHTALRLAIQQWSKKE